MSVIPADLEKICLSEFKGRSIAAFQKDASEVAALWIALVAAYGSDTLALQACRQNPQVVNPLYTSPPGLIGRSKAALVEVMGSHEKAIEVMLKNPAVLQCGVALMKSDAAEIEGFANIRGVLDSLPKETPTVALALLLASFAASVVDPAAASTVKPFLGAFGGGSFLIALYAASKSQKR